MRIELSHVESPVGRICFAVSDEGLHAMDFADTSDGVRARVEKWFPTARVQVHPAGDAGAPPHADVGADGRGLEGEASAREGRRAQDIASRLRAYFGGQLDALDTIAVASVGSPFQQRVWSALRGIRVGEIASYRAIARSIENPAAVRAVGAANKRNPVSLVVPCHRVIASDGTLCGYAGGLWRKEWLLRHEKAVLA